MTRPEYGVRFGDRSVAHPFNGDTQLMRCREMLARLCIEYPKGAADGEFTLVHRQMGGDWEPIVETPKLRVGDQIIWTAPDDGSGPDPGREFIGVITKIRRGGQEIWIEGPRDVRKVKDSGTD